MISVSWKWAILHFPFQNILYKKFTQNYDFFNNTNWKTNNKYIMIMIQ